MLWNVLHGRHDRFNRGMLRAATARAVATRGQVLNHLATGLCFTKTYLDTCCIRTRLPVANGRMCIKADPTAALIERNAAQRLRWLR